MHEKTFSFCLIKLWNCKITVGHSKISVNTNPYHRIKLITLQCKSTDFFYMIRVFTDRNVLIVKFIQIKYIKQPSFKPDFSLKHTFTNQYIAINRFSEKKKKGMLFTSFPSCIKNSRSLSRSSLSLFLCSSSVSRIIFS